ncbi:MAG TPA: cache domain-containing protein [Williamwhitmania sp.]|nr:cache domain-containing protein [Williamwhitmania sp.]
MRIKLKIRTKLLLSILTVTAFVYASSLGYLSFKLQDISLKRSMDLADAYARENANLTKANLNVDMDMTRGLTNTFSEFKSIPKVQQRVDLMRAIEGVAIENPNFLSVWVNIELSTMDSTYKKGYGRYRITYWRENGELKVKEEVLNTDGDNTESAYYQMKMSKLETVLDPYLFTYLAGGKPILETSVCVPLLEKNKFLGVFGLDLSLERFQPIIENIHPFAGSYAYLISNDGAIIAHTDRSLVGKKFSEVFHQQDSIFNVSTQIKEGKLFSYTTVDSTSGAEVYISYAPITIGRSITPWSIAIVAPINVLVDEANKTFNNSIIIGLAGLIILMLVIWILAYNITHPLSRTIKTIKRLAKGEFDTNNLLKVNSGDEIEEISNSVNTLIQGLSKTTDFAKEIGRGNLNVSYSSLGSNDMLGKALLEMQKSLSNAKQQEELRQIEDQKQTWATTGLAMFGEILRQNNDNLEELAYQVISNIVKYSVSNVGGLFLVNDENRSDVHLELKACFAYEKRKFLEKRIEMNEGLIGRCAQEAETIYLTEIPENYISIGSGLGEKAPTCLLLVPLKLNDQVFGVIEIASLNIIENYVVNFIEKLGETIASTLSNVKVNIRTVQLLEASRQQSEELSAQEEEMRQNMEELQATQEEAARKTGEMESLINALNASSFVVEYNLDGVIISVNDAMLSLLNRPREAVVGNHHSNDLLLSSKQKKDYEKFWNDLKKGITKKESTKLSINNKEYTFLETYTPIYNENHKIYKILKISHNITDFIK